jgi:hypothetical protein
MTENQTPDDLSAGDKLVGISASVDDLPFTDTKRWVAGRKAAVVNAVHSGAIGLEEACRRYELSAEEFLSWERGIEAHGVAGLRVTRLQIYRDVPSHSADKARY